MFGIHPSHRNGMDALSFWPGLSPHTMKFAMDLIEDCVGGSYMMGPRQCPTLRRRYCPHEGTPAWISPRNFLPLLNEVSFLLAPGSGTSTCTKNDQKTNTHNQSDKKGSCEEPKCCTAKCGTPKDEQENASTTVSENLNKRSDERPWQFSVDVGGCDEVRAFTQDGLLVVEGRGRNNDSSVTMRRVTKVPPHINPDKLKATLNKDGRLVLSTENDTKPPAVTSIPVSKEHEDTKETPEGEGITDEAEENNQKDKTDVEGPSQEVEEASSIDSS